MEKWMKGRYMTNQKRLSVGTGVPAPRGRGIVMLILLVLVVALAAVSVTTVAKLSSVNSRNIAMMQEQCRDAVALSTTLSRTASSSSAATVGKIRADVHAIDVINQMKMLQDGTNHAYVSTELISRIYTILDAYSNQLITGANEPFCGTAGTFGGIVRTIKREGHCHARQCLFCSEKF